VLRRRARLATAALDFSAAEKLDGVRDDLGRVTLLAVLVPRTRLETALDVDRTPLVEILGAILSGLSPDLDAMPLGLFLLLSVLGPRFVRGQAQLADGL